MKRAALVALALGGCSLREPRTSMFGPSSATSGIPCITSAQCGSNVCFLGECRAPASNLSQVLVSIAPPPDAGFAAKQVRVDLRQSVIYDLALQPPFVANGAVGQDPDTGGGSATPVGGASIVFTDPAPIIPDRPEQVSTTTDASGAFTASLAAGDWDMLIVPPAPYPPYRTTFQTATPTLDVHLPAPQQVSVSVVTSTDAGFPSASVTAVDPLEGDPLSAPATSQADGGYTLLLSSGTQLSSVRLQVGPVRTTDGGTPSSSVVPVYDPVALDGGTVRLPLPAQTTISGLVVDLGGTPIAAAAVYARSDGSQPWSLSRSTMTASDGTFSLDVLSGNYLIEAAPALSDAAAVSSTATITAPGQVTLKCPPKVRRIGSVVTADAHVGGPDFQVIASRTADKLLITRTAVTTPTDSRGVFHIVADPGVYRVEIVPPASSGLPRRIVSLTLPEDTSGVETPIDPILLSPPLAVVGTITGQLSPGGATAPVPAVAIGFYALDAVGHSVFIGSATSDSNGQFRAVLPDVQNPGL